jgi:hypothetical protein
MTFQSILIAASVSSSVVGFCLEIYPSRLQSRECENTNLEKMHHLLSSSSIKKNSQTEVYQERSPPTATQNQQNRQQLFIKQQSQFIHLFIISKLNQISS